MVTQIPGGILAQKIGCKWVLGFGVTFGGVATLITPWAAFQGIGVIIAVRVVLGMSHVSCDILDEFHKMIISY